MERLTERTNKGFSHLVGKDVCYSHISYDCPRIEGLHLLDKALEKLAEYEDLEENGLLLRLKDEPGAMSYFMADEENIYILCRPDGYKEICKNKHKEWNASEKKYVFLTEAEAKAKLKEMEGENEN